MRRSGGSFATSGVASSALVVPLVLAAGALGCLGAGGDGENGSDAPGASGDSSVQVVESPGPVGTMTYYPLRADNTTGPERAWFIDSHIPKLGDWWLIPGYVFEVSPDGTRFVWGAMEEVQNVFKMSLLSPGATFSDKWKILLFGMEQALFAPDSRALLGKNILTKKWEYFVPGTEAHFLTGNGQPGGHHVPPVPVWGADSRSFLVWGADNVSLFELDDRHWTLPFGTGDDLKEYVVPSISPNAEWVALAYYREPGEGQGYERQYLGVQLYHIPSRSFTAVELGDGPDGLKLGFASALSPGPASTELPAPWWSADSKYLVFDRQYAPQGPDACDWADHAYVSLLDVAASVEKGKDVVTSRPLGLNAKAGACLVWSVSGSLPQPDGLLVTVHGLKTAEIEGKEGFLSQSVTLYSLSLASGESGEVARLDNECSDGPHGLCQPITPGNDTILCRSWRYGDVLLASGLLVDLADGTMGKVGFPLTVVSPDCSAFALDAFPAIEIYGFEGELLGRVDMSIWEAEVRAQEKRDEEGVPAVDFGIRHWR